MIVNLGNKHNAHRIFLTLLTDSVQQMLKLHSMMESQFLRYHTILGTTCDGGNWIISSHFAEFVFAGTWRARLIGVDAFSETGHTHCAVYLWVALQTHMVIQNYIELGFTTHLGVSSVVVEHLIQTRVPMTMHNAVKLEVNDLTTKVKTAYATVEKLESKLGRQATDIATLQKEIKSMVKK
jgi:hypothetical protein